MPPPSTGFERLRSKDDHEKDRLLEDSGLLGDSDVEASAPEGGDGGGATQVLKVGVIRLAIVFIIFAAVVISTNLIVKSAIQGVGSYALGVDVGVSSVSLSPFFGRSSIHGLDIHSPTGFDLDLMRLRSVVFDLSFWAVVGQAIFNIDKPFLIKEFRASDLLVHVEQELDGTSNARVVLDRMVANHSLSPRPNSRVMSAKVIVDRLDIDNITFALSMAALSTAVGPVTYTLKKVRLEGIGSKDKKGATLHELFKDVVKAVLSAGLSQTGGAMKDKLLQDLEGVMGKLHNFSHAKEVYLDVGSGLHAGLHEAKRWASNVTDSMLPSGFPNASELLKEGMHEVAKEGMHKAEEEAEEVMHNWFGSAR